MTFVKGQSGNPEGRPIGSKKEKSFIEFYDEICEEIAQKNNMTVDEVKKVVYKVGYAKAKEGNYAFYKDVLDRIHGQAKQPLSNADGKAFMINITKEIAQQNDITTDQGTSDNSDRPSQV